MKRLEVLLTKCKETIKANKERTQQLVSDKEAVQKQLELKTQEHDLLTVSRAVSDVYCMTSGSHHFSLLHSILKRTFKRVSTSVVPHLLNLLLFLRIITNKYQFSIIVIFLFDV